MVMLHVQVSLELIALSFGLALLIWGMRNKGVGVQLAKFFGVIITVLSIIGVLNAGYLYTRLWNEGYFERPMHMMQQMQNNNNMPQHPHN